VDRLYRALVADDGHFADDVQALVAWVTDHRIDPRDLQRSLDAEGTPMTRSIQSPVPGTDFGIFYPVGYIVAGVPRGEDAERVQRDLRTGGYAEADCRLFDTAQVAQEPRQQRRRPGPAGPGRRRGQATSRGGQQGRFVPVDLCALGSRSGGGDDGPALFVFAHRYHRLAIEETS
jgi:hypothetical protein